MRPVDENESLTVYEELSQKIGFSSSVAVTIPSIAVAKNLLKLVKVANSIEATEAVMRVVRFAPSARNDEERESKKICCEASKLARESFGG